MNCHSNVIRILWRVFAALCVAGSLALEASQPLQAQTSTSGLLLNTIDGLYLTNAAGTPPVKLTTAAQVNLLNGWRNGINGKAGVIATRGYAASDKSDAALYLVTLADRSVVKIASLLSAQALANPQTRAGAILAATASDALAWSPDGRYLAFAAAIDGASTDLYIYDLSTRALRRISDGPTETVTPVWSPDSTRVIYGAARFDANGYYTIGAIWVSSPATSAQTRLYTPMAPSASEVIVGWRSPAVYVVVSRTPRGLCNVRLVNAQSRRVTPVYRGCTVPSGDARAIALAASGAWIAYSTPAGISILDIGAAQARRVPNSSAFANAHVRAASGTGYIQIHGPEFALLSHDLNLRITSGSADGAVSPDGRWRAWYTAHGLVSVAQIDRGIGPQAQTSNIFNAIKWSDDSQAVALRTADQHIVVFGVPEGPFGAQVIRKTEISGAPELVFHGEPFAWIGTSSPTQPVCDNAWFVRSSILDAVCPSGPALSQSMAVQHFEHGLMVWFGDNRSILALIDDGAGGYVTLFGNTDDTWKEGDPVDDPALMPPAGLRQPVRGFGKVWRENNLRARLGWATDSEQGYPGASQIANPVLKQIWLVFDTPAGAYRCVNNGVPQWSCHKL